MNKYLIAYKRTYYSEVLETSVRTVSYNAAEAAFRAKHGRTVVLVNIIKIEA